MTRRPLAPLLAAGVAIAAATAATPPASADDAGAQLSPLRQETVDRANRLLAGEHDYRASAGGVLRSSRPNGARNYFEAGGSNANRNEFNGFNGQDWCGFFLATVWTGQRVPARGAYPRLPRYYERSQAWRTDAGGRYRAFRAGRLPQPGDVLVWQNGAGTAGVPTSTATGHVGVVVAVNPSTKRVTTVEGNVNGDEIARRSYAWDADGPSLPGKHFLGHVLRE